MRKILMIFLFMVLLTSKAHALYDFADDTGVKFRSKDNSYGYLWFRPYGKDHYYHEFYAGNHEHVIWNIKEQFVISNGPLLKKDKNGDYYKLVVNGSIFAVGSIVVKPSIHADFVFEDDYELMSLPALEASIKKNKHLPGIPATAEVLKDGIDVGDFQCKILQKVEELTLYIIEQDKRIRYLETKF